MKNLQCPSCGGSNPVHNPGIHVVVCAFCRTTIYREEDVLRAGKESVVAEPRGALAVGKAGRVGDYRLTLLGRVQFEWDGGRWDEWYAVDASGRSWWLIEDEKTLAMEQAVTGYTPPADLELGTRLVLGGVSFEVDELGTARCLGGEGQLPRVFHPGETYRYADATEVDGDKLLSIEIAPDDPTDVSVFRGRAVALETVDFGAIAHDPTQEAQEGAAIQCVGCGAGFEPPRQETVVTAVCTHCGRQLELSEAGVKAIGQNKGMRHFPLDIGDVGEFDGVEFEIVGRLIHDYGDEDFGREYLLWEAQNGYRWLEEDDGAYLLMRPTPNGPSREQIDGCKAGDKLVIDEAWMTCAERGSSTVSHVDGALPWRARVGDRGEYVDFRALPRVYSIEISATELERFVGRRISSALVLRAFGKSTPQTVRSGPTEPYWTPGLRMVVVVAGIFALINVGAVLVGATGGTVVMRGSASAEEVATGEWTSPPFTIEEGTKVMSLEVETTLNNGWLAVDTELLAGEEEDVIGFSAAELSYYHGVDSDGSWSEGRRSRTRLFKAPPPGEYKIALSMEGDQSPDVRVEVKSGAAAARFHQGMFALCLLIAGAVVANNPKTSQTIERWADD